VVVFFLLLTVRIWPVCRTGPIRHRGPFRHQGEPRTGVRGCCPGAVRAWYVFI